MYRLRIKNNQPYLVNGSYQRKLIGYDNTDKCFIRQDDCKVSENLVSNLVYLKGIFNDKSIKQTRP